MPAPGKPRGSPSGQSQGRRLEQRSLELIRSALRGAGWELSSVGGTAGPLLVAQKGPRAYALELKASSGRARRPVLQALLADAILQARAAAREIGGIPLAVLAASSVSDEIAGELRSYVERCGEGVAWGLIDGRGRFELHGPDLSSIRLEKQKPFFKERLLPEPSLHNPFSDLGQWLLKVLMAGKIPEPFLRAPRDPIHSMVELAEKANVSPASASRFLSALESEGYVGHDENGAIRLVRMRALLDAWRIAGQKRVEKRYARFLLPASDPLDRLRGVLAERWPHRALFESDASIAESVGPIGERACLALFAACRALGIGFVRGAPLHLYAEDLSPDFLKKLELRQVDHRSEADLIVLRPPFPESVFRGCVIVDGYPVADALQCWMDVSFEPARGGEQADEIAQRLGFEEWTE